MRRCKVLFQLTVIVSKENLNLQSAPYKKSTTYLIQKIYIWQERKTNQEKKQEEKIYPHHVSFFL